MSTRSCIYIQSSCSTTYTHLEVRWSTAFAPVLQFCVRIIVSIVAFGTAHMVRRYGARRFFSTDQLNPHRKRRLFYGLPPYSTVRCGSFFLLSIILRCGAVRFLFFTVRCGADFLQNSTVRCGSVLLEAKSYACGSVKPHRTAP